MQLFSSYIYIQYIYARPVYSREGGLAGWEIEQVERPKRNTRNDTAEKEYCINKKKKEHTSIFVDFHTFRFLCHDLSFSLCIVYMYSILYRKRLDFLFCSNSLLVCKLSSYFLCSLYHLFG